MGFMCLDGLWDMHWRPEGRATALPSGATVSASVPGDVHGDLVSAGLLPDPLVGTNCRLHTFLEECDFIYRRAFDCAGRFDRAELVFEGLDCLAEVHLDGSLLGRASNAFIAHCFDVTPQLQSAASHEIEVTINSGVTWARTQDNGRYRALFSPERIWLRKPQFVFGWDWAPRLVSCGIWKNVRLQVYNGACIRDYHIRHKPVRRGGSRPRYCISVNVEVECFRQGRYTLRFDLGSELSVTRRTLLHAGVNRLELELQAPSLHFWYPSGYGKQVLYPLALSLSERGTEIDRLEGEHGFRTIVLDQDPIKGCDGKGCDGRRFRFVVNGIPVFALGANWVPPDLIPARITEEKKLLLLREAVRCNMNMLRLWGGGIYETEEFYRQCDRLGILVWQDFMFSCAEYPDDHDWFIRSVEEEGRFVLTGLRNHPCLALLCGNNENHWIYGYCKRGPHRGLRPFHGRKLYDELLPELCSELIPTVPYWPSSPYGGEFPNSDEEGDKHSWSVTMLSRVAGERSDVRRYRLEEGKFISEYGVLSCALPRSIREATGEGQIDAHSPAYRFHDNTANDGKIEEYLRTGFGRAPEDVHRYIWESLAYQAAGYREAIVHHRKRHDVCGGSLFWMYSDCWGTHGWSIIDYYLRKKPSYYWVRRAYSPLAVFSIVEDEKAEVWIANDTSKKLAIELYIDTGCFEPKTGNRVVRRLEVFPRQALRAAVLYVVPGWIAAEVYLAGRLAAEDTMLTHHARHLKLREARLEVQRMTGSAGETVLRIQSDDFVHMIRLEIPDDAAADDNYFNLAPGREKTIAVRGLGARPVHVSAFNVPLEITV